MQLIIKICLIILAIFAGIVCFSQGQANNWHFGAYAGINFNTGNPVALFNSAMRGDEGMASMSDKNGQLLFYTDASTIWNRNNQPMPNGTGLLGTYACSQGAAIVQQPGNDSLYYVFTMDEHGNAGGLHYSIVDIHLNGGMGDVIQKNTPLVTPTCERMTTARHCNGRDIWVIVQQYPTGEYYAYLIDPAGLTTAPVVSHSGNAISNFGQISGCMKTSPDGKHLAAAFVGSDGYIDLFDFNRATGQLSNRRQLQAKPAIPDLRGQGHYGIEFSPDSRFLYCTSSWAVFIDSAYLYQFDITAATEAAIQSTAVQLYKFRSQGIGLFGALQLGPDKKIYTPTFASPYLSVIHQPDSPGMASSFQFNAVYTSTAVGSTLYNSYGLPNFSSFYFYDPIIASGNCQFQNVSFSLGNTPGIATINWDFDDPATGVLNYSTAMAPTHLFSSIRLFKVKAAISYTSGCTDTVYKTILPGPLRIFLGNDTTICKGDTLLLKAALPNSFNYWSNGSTDTILKITTSGNYWVKVRFGDCIAIDSINVTVRQPPQFTLGNDTVICNNASLNLAPNPPHTGAAYLWSNNATTSFITVSTADDYWLRLTDSYGCKWRDTIAVSFRALPYFNLGNDTAICYKDTLSLNATVNNATAYQWGTGAQTHVIKVYEPGIYWCDVNKEGCTYRDSLRLAIKPLPAVHLGSDTTICENTNLLLDAQNPGSTYLWNTGAVASTITAGQTGLYFVTVTKDGCVGKDSIRIATELKPRFSLGSDQLICPGEIITLQPLTEPSWQLRWQDGSTVRTYRVTQPGIYSLDASTRCGTLRDEILFTKGLCRVNIPNSFTPNEDGRNDVLKVLGTEIVTDFHFQIFNRYGQLVFETRDKNRGWDGRIKDKKANAGAYIYMVSYKDMDITKQQVIRGTVIVII